MKTITLTFTDSALAALTCGTDNQRHYRDKEVRALRLCVGRNTKTFYTQGRGAVKREHHVIGHFVPGAHDAIENARTAARKQKKAWENLRKGRALVTDTTAGPVTSITAGMASIPVETLRPYMERHIKTRNASRARKNRVPMVCEMQLRAGFKNHFADWLDLPVTIITPVAVLDRTNDNVPSRVLACLRAVLRVPIRLRLIHDPFVFLDPGTVG